MTRETVLGAALAAFAFACASSPPPRGEVARAEQAVERAEQEGAHEHAPLPLRKAEEELEDAKRAMREERYVDARRAAELAQAQAELATASAQRARAQELVEELSQTLGALEEDTR
jgi:hypothetical protein